METTNLTGQSISEVGPQTQSRLVPDVRSSADGCDRVLCILAHADD